MILGKSPIDFNLQFRVKSRMLTPVASGRQLHGAGSLVGFRLHTDPTGFISDIGDPMATREVRSMLMALLRSRSRSPTGLQRCASTADAGLRGAAPGQEGTEITNNLKEEVLPTFK